VLESSPIRGAIPVPPVVEATMVGEHLGEDEIEEVGEDVEPGRWRRQLDTCTRKRREHSFESILDVRIEVRDPW
jgi:hypothetical protein